jgi:hypothetical protein
VLFVNAELYRSYAQECLHFASGMETPESKAVLIAMAETWLRLAGRAEKNERGSGEAGGGGARGDALLDPPGL